MDSDIAASRTEDPRIVLAAQLPGETVRSWAYHLLLANILQLYLPPGTPITENELARMLRASRTPIREALKQLAAEGFVEIRSQTGTRVSLIDAGLAEEDRFHRMCLEREIAAIVAESAPDEWFVTLRAQFEMLRLAFRDNNAIRFVELDESFHQGMYQCCGKGRLWDMLKKSSAHLTRARVLNIMSGHPHEWELVITQHQAILAALRDRDRKAAAKATETHLSRPGWNVDALRARFPEYFTA